MAYEDDGWVYEGLGIEDWELVAGQFAGPPVPPAAPVASGWMDMRTEDREDDYFVMPTTGTVIDNIRPLGRSGPSLLVLVGVGLVAWLILKRR